MQFIIDANFFHGEYPYKQCIEDNIEESSKISTLDKAVHKKFIHEYDYENRDDFCIQDGAIDSLSFGKKLFEGFVPPQGWNFYDNGEENPGISYYAGGHIAPHHDSTNFFSADCNMCTFIYCFFSNDENGGTRLYLGGGKTHDAKQSVTNQKGVIFPTHTIHAGIPVSDFKCKLIMQNQFIMYRVRVPKIDLIKIDLLDGYYVMRKVEFQYYTGPPTETLTKKEFYPTYVGLRGHPTKGNRIYANPENYFEDTILTEYDEVEEGWYNTLDEATYFADDKQLECAIYYNGKLYENATVETLNDIHQKFERLDYRETIKDKVCYPFKKFAQLELFDSYTEKYYESLETIEEYGQRVHKNIHIAWKIIS